ncbi:toxin glutamine deamidase domain-containing protein [Frankia sp. AgB32]|uniref:toxin glutamine deamidase domain-containing protein n=1 Tax=Frankia sp. AgB32 TaxID=631119 RepID=UPI00200E56D3|nr:toxin glutamine deamidase domain-containing protein [Frankia sp. AgB32]MCK9897876.1 toxin glutamine deamidase domain-containing protein [Frankia sp. AgB32]
MPMDRSGVGAEASDDQAAPPDVAENKGLEAKLRLLGGSEEVPDSVDRRAADDAEPSRTGSAEIEAKLAALERAHGREERGGAADSDRQTLDVRVPPSRSEPPLDRKLALLERAAARADSPGAVQAAPAEFDGGVLRAGSPGWLGFIRRGRPEIGMPPSEGHVAKGMRDIWSKYPDDYLPPDASKAGPDVTRPHQHPADWVEDINPDRAAPGRDNNCGDCTRASELTWRGEPSEAAALADPDALGEPAGRMQVWAGAEFRLSDSDEIEDDLRRAGPGSSAVVLVRWSTSGAHFFNAVNEGGRVLAVDGQGGTVEAWPPSEEVTGYSDVGIADYYTILFDGDGEILRRDSA